MSGSVQWAILVPVILLTVLGAIQVGLWAYGRTVASHAAIAAAEEAALLGASEADARALGTEIASGGGLTDIQVQLVVDANNARATVRGRMPTFVDLGQTRVSEQATRPREQVTRP
jgi:Flp pilus assembly protein TadG